MASNNKNFTNWNIQNYSEDVTNLNITQALVKAADNTTYDYNHEEGSQINPNFNDGKVVKLLVEGAAVFSHGTDNMPSKGINVYL